MGNSRPAKGKAAPLPDDDEEEDPRVLLERLYRTRLELQRMLALSAEADETICMLAAAACRVKQERDEAYMRRNALMAELQTRRNARRAMVAAALASGPPRAVFSPSSRYGGRALVVRAPALFRRVTTQEQYYAQAAGVSYCYASSSSSTSGHGAFDPNMFLVDPAEGGPVAPAKTTATGSGAPGLAGKKKSSGSELGLVAEQILRLSRKKAEVVEADAGTSVEEAAADSESTEDEVGGSVGEKEECCSGGGSSSLDDVVGSADKKRGDDA